VYVHIGHPNSQRAIAYVLDVRRLGPEPQTTVNTPEELRAFLAAHPEVQAVMFHDSRMPRRAVPAESVTDKLLRKLFRVPGRRPA
jgi:hypothetical protein